jgi:hypothetical protein
MLGLAKAVAPRALPTEVLCQRKGRGPRRRPAAPSAGTQQARQFRRPQTGTDPAATALGSAVVAQSAESTAGPLAAVFLGYRPTDATSTPASSLRLWTLGALALKL